MPRPPYPRNVGDFNRMFPDEEACVGYLAACRWPDGFRCPECGHDAAFDLPRRRLWQCKECGHQTSVTAGTVMHRTRTPLLTWFWAAFWMTAHKPGLSALQLQHMLGLARYETAWLILHKLRRAMVDATREQLKGTVEIDETFIGGEQLGLRGGRRLTGRAVSRLSAMRLDRHGVLGHDRRSHGGRAEIGEGSGGAYLRADRCHADRMPTSGEVDNTRVRACGVEPHTVAAQTLDHPGMETRPFVPADFVVPRSLETPLFRLEPLAPGHNDADHAAWTSSVEHIRRTPGWPDGRWPDDRSLADNLRDLHRHADDFEHRRGFTYTVLEPVTGDVIGCVYIYPDPGASHRAHVQSWVRATHAKLDVPLWRAVSDWLQAVWPFEGVTYHARPWPSEG